MHPVVEDFSGETMGNPTVEPADHTAGAVNQTAGADCRSDEDDLHRARMGVRQALAKVERRRGIEMPGHQTRRALLAKVLGRIDDRLSWLEQLHSASELRGRSDSASKFGMHMTRLGNLVEQIVLATSETEMNESELWELESQLRIEADTVSPLSIVISDIRRALDDIRARPDDSQDYAEDSRVMSLIVKGEHVELDPVQVLMLYRQRVAHNTRHRRAAEARRRQLLLWSAFILSALVLLFAATVAILDPGATEGLSWWYVASAQLAGAFGACLSVMRKVRDDLKRLTEMDALVAALWAQLAAGAGLGVFALLLFQAGLLPTVGSAAENVGVEPIGIAYAFLAGFSEPFVIQAVTRLTSAS